jgi:hypothetical protein
MAVVWISWAMLCQPIPSVVRPLVTLPGPQPPHIEESTHNCSTKKFLSKQLDQADTTEQSFPRWLLSNFFFFLFSGNGGLHHEGHSGLQILEIHTTLAVWPWGFFKVFLIDVGGSAGIESCGPKHATVGTYLQWSMAMCCLHVCSLQSHQNWIPISRKTQRHYDNQISYLCRSQEPQGPQEPLEPL